MARGPMCLLFHKVFDAGAKIIRMRFKITQKEHVALFRTLLTPTNDSLDSSLHGCP